MALEELMGFTNTASSVIGFALLLIVLSYNLAQLNVTVALANSQAFATALGPRLITSPNCFAYQQYSSAFNGKNLQTQEVVIPGMIDVRKLTQDQFLNCMQYIYYYEASQVPLTSYLVASAVGVHIAVVDTQDPHNLPPVYLSNYPQYTFGSAFNGITQAVGSVSTAVNWILFALSSILNLAIAIGTVGVGSAISIILNIPVSANFYSEFISSSILIAQLNGEQSYSETYPVILVFTTPDGQTFENYGYMQVTINYALYPYAPKGLAFV
jgi:hypothetical protein